MGDSDSDVVALESADRKGRDEQRRKAKIKFESALGREEAATYLEAIVDGLRKGELEFRTAGEELLLSPGPRIDLSLKATRKGGTARLQLEMEWPTK